MTSSQDQVRQWGSVADAYVHSSFHASGPDLARLVSEAALTGKERVLDLGCGAGHTSLACAAHAAEVIAVDVTPQQLAGAVVFHQHLKFRRLAHCGLKIFCNVKEHYAKVVILCVYSSSCSIPNVS